MSAIAARQASGWGHPLIAAFFGSLLEPLPFAVRRLCSLPRRLGRERPTLHIR